MRPDHQNEEVYLPRLQSRLAGVLTMCGIMRPLLLGAAPVVPFGAIVDAESMLEAVAPAAAAATLSVVADLFTAALLAAGGDGGGGGRCESGSGLLLRLLLFLTPRRLPSLK